MGSEKKREEYLATLFLRWVGVKNYECDLHLRSREVLKQEWHPSHHTTTNPSFPNSFLCALVQCISRKPFLLFPASPFNVSSLGFQSSIRGFESARGIFLSCGWSSYPIFLLKLRDFSGKKRKPQTSYVSQTNQ